MTCTLFNTSFVPMNFVLRVLGDGQGSPSVTSDRQVCEMTLNNWQGGAAKDPWSRPVEFSVSPAADSVRAMSDVTIKVKFWPRQKCAAVGPRARVWTHQKYNLENIVKKCCVNKQLTFSAAYTETKQLNNNMVFNI